MSSARDEILGKLRGSLAKHKPFADVDARLLRHPELVEGSKDASLQPVTHIADDEDLRARFITEVERVKGVVHAAESEDDARHILRELLTSHNVVRATMWDERYMPLPNVEATLSELNIARVQGDNESVATAEAGITGADWAIAATGTLVLSSGAGRSRMASLLPPMHIAVVTTDQLVPRLEDYIAAQRADRVEIFRTSSNVTLITGCSRTSDIEMQPVFGVHGPLELHIILIDASR